MRDREDALEIAPARRMARLRSLLDYAPALGCLGVPELHSGGATGFEELLDLVEETRRGLLDELRTRARRGAAS